MKHLLILFSALLCSFIGLAQTSFSTQTLPPLPGWTENKGQITDLDYFQRPDILYSYQSQGVNFFLKPHGITQEFLKYNQEQYQVNEATGLIEKVENPISSISRIKLKMEFVNANEACLVTAEKPRVDYLNYYSPAAPEGILMVQRYQKIIYHDLWSSIDMVWTLSDEGEMKYEFIVHPGGSPDDIAIRYQNSTIPSISEDGALLFENDHGWLREEAPISFSGSQEISTQYHWNDGLLSFQLEEYDVHQVLIIDPVRTWGTFYGGTQGDFGLALLTDSAANIYLTGGVRSDGMASSNGQDQTNDGDFDVILAKFDSAGNRIWATYFGGTLQDIGKDLALLSGNIILGGQVKSTTLSTSGVFQEGYGGGNDDALLASFASNDGTLNWSSYVGGNKAEDGFAVATGNGGIYIVGYTASADFPITPGVLQTSINAERDGFISHVSEDGTSLLWSTFLGGNMDDEIQDILVEKSGNLVIGGDTESTDVISVPSVQSQNCFVARVASDGSSLLTGILIGADGEDVLHSVGQDSAGNIFYAGTTSSTGLNDNSNTTLMGNTDCFIGKISPIGIILWRRYYGGMSDESSEGMTVTQSGDIILGGATDSQTGIALSFGNLDTTYAGGTDAFLSKFDTDGNLLWGTYIGGSQNDEARDVAINKTGDILAIGKTSSPSGISTGSMPFQAQAAGDVDTYLINIKEYPDYDLSNLNLDPFQPIPNEKIRINLTVKNRGAISSPETEVKIYVSQDDTISSSDLLLLTVPVSALSAQDSFPLLDSTVLAGSLTPGAYYLIAVIDEGQQVEEDYEDNNQLILPFSTPAATFNNSSLTGAILSGEITNPQLVDNSTIFLKPMASGDWTQIDGSSFIDVNTGQFEYEVDFGMGDEQGLKCYFEISSGVISFSTDTFYAYRTIDQTEYFVDAGSEESDYKIFSIPLDLNFKNLTDILIESFQEQDASAWRVAEYRDGETKETLTEATPGAGYWIISREPDTLIIGTGTTVAVTTPEPFCWNLDSGVHLIGNPYRFPISWNDILSFNGTPSVQGFITFDQGFSYNDVLQPLEGAFICTNQPIKLEVPLYKNPKFNRQESPYLSNPLDSEHWEVALSLTSGNLTNKTTIIGMRPDASTSKDPFDFQPIPHFPNSPVLNIQREEQFFSKDMLPLAKTGSWRLVLQNNQGKETRISWDPSSFGDNFQMLVLEDVGTGNLIDMRRHQGYTFESSEQTALFTVHFGDVHTLSQILRPGKFLIDPLYPNPVQSDLYIPLQLPERGAVLLTAFDGAGKLLWTLPAVELEAGFQTIKWGDFGTSSSLEGQLIVVKAQLINENGQQETAVRKVMIRRK